MTTLLMAAFLALFSAAAPAAFAVDGSEGVASGSVGSAAVSAESSAQTSADTPAGAAEGITSQAGIVEDSVSQTGTADGLTPQIGTVEGIIPQATFGDGTCGGCDWVIDSTGTLKISKTAGGTGVLDNINTYSSPAPWNSYYSKIVKVVVGAGVKAGADAALFMGCSYATDINISALDISAVKNASGMFQGCSSLASIEFPGQSKAHLTESSAMFWRCSSLKSLDLAAFDTSDVASFNTMFSGCSSLKSLDLTDLDTSSATNMAGMFSSCSSLNSLDLSKFNTSKVAYMSNMFSYCTSLASLDLSKFDTSSATSMYGMFWSCTGLTSLDISGFTFKNGVDLGSMFNGCSKLETVTFPKTTGDSQIKSMSSMFNGCSSLKSLDLSKLDTSSAKNMYRMFYGCNSLTDLKLGGAFSTAGASGMTEMFYECASLTALDLSTFDTSSVTEPSSSPSSSDGSLQPLEGSGSTTGMTNMFSGCNRLATLVLGAKFKFVGSATLISPNSSYINGATGNWKSKVDGKIYTAAQIASDRGGIADTYTAETSGTNTDISAATISPIPSQVYSGSSLTPVFTVRLGDKTLSQGTDYTVSYQNAAGFTSHSLVSAGTYIVYVVGVNTVDKGGYWGTKTASFTITPCNIDAATLSSSTTTYTYTGSNQTPTFDCTLDGKTISTYMTYTYKDANGNEVIPREVGTYTATATANGNYQGTTKPLSFTIEKANIGEYNSSTISGVAPSYAHTGQTVKPVPAVIYKDSKLTPDTDYTIEIRKDSPTAGEVVTAPTDDGTYYLCITGKGSYQGTIYVSYKIEDTMTATDINFATVSCAGDFYSGDALTPSCAVTLGATGSGETARHLVEGTDYTVTLEDNQGKEVKPCIDAGDYTLVITGKGAYAGVTKKDKLFTVNPEPIYYCTWVAVSDQTYTGKPITPSIDLTFNNRALVKDTDYTLTFADSAGNTIATPTDVGTYRAVITGKGNYVSMSYRSFNIVSKCTSFTDVKSDVATNGFDNVWYVHDGWLDFVVSNGLMSGYTDGSGNFGTYDSITRGQVATILYRYECGKDSTLEATYGSTYNTGGKKYATDTVFADEASGAYYTAAINWAKAVGIMTGDSSTGYTTVRPDDPVQRQELCLMLARFAQKVEHASAAEGSVDYSGVKGMDAVDSWAIAGVKWCASYGVVGGVNVGGTYYMNPTDPSWRASMAKMITVTVRDVL